MASILFTGDNTHLAVPMFFDPKILLAGCQPPGQVEIFQRLFLAFCFSSHLSGRRFAAPMSSSSRCRRVRGVAAPRLTAVPPPPFRDRRSSPLDSRPPPINRALIVVVGPRHLYPSAPPLLGFLPAPTRHRWCARHPAFETAHSVVSLPRPAFKVDARPFLLPSMLTERGSLFETSAYPPPLVAKNRRLCPLPPRSTRLIKRCQARRTPGGPDSADRGRFSPSAAMVRPKTSVPCCARSTCPSPAGVPRVLLRLNPDDHTLPSASLLISAPRGRWSVWSEVLPPGLPNTTKTLRRRARHSTPGTRNRRRGGLPSRCSTGSPPGRNSTRAARPFLPP